MSETCTGVRYVDCRFCMHMPVADACVSCDGVGEIKIACEHGATSAHAVGVADRWRCSMW